MNDTRDGDVLVTVSIACGSAEEAAMLAGELVAQRLAACAQSWPIRSTYRWQGEIAHDDEQLLQLKTTAGKLGAVERLVRERHSYDVSEIVAQPLSWASADYARWVRESVGPGA